MQRPRRLFVRRQEWRFSRGKCSVEEGSRGMCRNPRCRSEDIDVSVENGTVVIKAEKKHEREENENDDYRTEPNYGGLRRSIALLPKWTNQTLKPNSNQAG